jgi:ABC-type antimicrobial peptide transport system permease subunit
MFVPLEQRPERLMSGVSIVVRTNGAAAGVPTAVRSRIHDVDANVPVELSSMDALIDRSVATRRFSTIVLSSFAGLALFLVVIGIYGILAYSVAQRSREIAVRMALGARRGTVRALIVRDGLRAVVPGLIVGLGGAWLLTRSLRSLLFGVQPGDPVTIASTVALVLFVALLACWVPASRAARTSPMLAIRAE